jgi:hypothetical protein
MNKFLSLLFTVACALLVSTIAPITTAAGVKKGHSPIDVFDVMHDGEVVGEVRVNTAKAKTTTYVLIADGLTPNTNYTFGYFTLPAEDPHLLGSRDTTKSGVLHMNGILRPEDVQDLEAAQFWVTETGPADDYHEWIYGIRLYQDGWFIAQLGVRYSTDGGITWKEYVLESNLLRGERITMPLESLGVPEHALVKIHVKVIAGKDRTGSEIFESDYSYFTYWGYRIAEYGIAGTTGNPTLTYYGIDIDD